MHPKSDLQAQTQPSCSAQDRKSNPVVDCKIAGQIAGSPATPTASPSTPEGLQGGDRLPKAAVKTAAQALAQGQRPSGVVPLHTSSLAVSVIQLLFMIFCHLSWCPFHAACSITLRWLWVAFELPLVCVSIAHGVLTVLMGYFHPALPCPPCLACPCLPLPVLTCPVRPCPALPATSLSIVRASCMQWLTCCDAQQHSPLQRQLLLMCTQSWFCINSTTGTQHGHCTHTMLLSIMLKGHQTKAVRSLLGCLSIVLAQCMWTLTRTLWAPMELALHGPTAALKHNSKAWPSPSTMHMVRMGRTVSRRAFRTGSMIKQKWPLLMLR